MSDGERKKVNDFYEITKSKPPNPLLVKAVEILEHKNTALDLGVVLEILLLDVNLRFDEENIFVSLFF